MKPVEIYTTPFCPYCIAAKRLLQSKGVAFAETDVSRDPALRQAMMRRAGAGTPCRRSSSAASMSAAATICTRWTIRGGWARCWRTDARRPGPADGHRRPGAEPAATSALVRQAADQGATFVLTPEMTNALSSSRDHQRSVFRHEAADETLADLRAIAAEKAVTLLIGSLGLLTDDADGRFANRSLLIGPDGGILARYDKIHMFDVNVSATEVYRESQGYRRAAGPCWPTRRLASWA